MPEQGSTFMCWWCVVTQCMNPPFLVRGFTWVPVGMTPASRAATPPWRSCSDTRGVCSRQCAELLQIAMAVEGRWDAGVEVMELPHPSEGR